MTSRLINLGFVKTDEYVFSNTSFNLRYNMVIQIMRFGDYTFQMSVKYLQYFDPEILINNMARYKYTYSIDLPVDTPYDIPTLLTLLDREGTFHIKIKNKYTIQCSRGHIVSRYPGKEMMWCKDVDMLSHIHEMIDNWELFESKN